MFNEVFIFTIVIVECVWIHKYQFKHLRSLSNSNLEFFVFDFFFKCHFMRTDVVALPSCTHAVDSPTETSKH